MSAPYREGTFFLLPLGKSGTFATGLVARVSPRGVLLGYFFGPRRRQAPGPEWLAGVTANHAAFVARFKDMPLYRGEWRVAGERAGFARADWPVPAFRRFDGGSTYIPGTTAVTDWRVEYADDNLIVPVRETPATAQDLKLGDDLVYDAALLAEEVARRVGDAVPSADDATWR